MPFKASTAQDNDALPACAHLPPRSGLVQRFLSGVGKGLDQRNLELILIEHMGAHILEKLWFKRKAKNAVDTPIQPSATAKAKTQSA